jgi:hypothetical protein
MKKKFESFFKSDKSVYKKTRRRRSLVRILPPSLPPCMLYAQAFQWHETSIMLLMTLSLRKRFSPTDQFMVSYLEG